MKLVDMLVLGTSAAMRVGSSPTEGNKISNMLNRNIGNLNLNKDLFVVIYVSLQ